MRNDKMTLRIFYLFGVFFGLSILGGAVAEERYLTALPDVPLAPGLREMTDAKLVFDKPEGRIVQLAATPDAGHKGGSKALAEFYMRTLPNLGWQRTARQPLTFIREGETLRIGFHDDLVIFDVTPVTAE